MNDQPPNPPQGAWIRTNPGEATLNGVNWGGLRTLYIKEVRRFFKVQMQTVWAPAVTTMLYLIIFTVAMGGSGVWLLKSLFWAPILGWITGKRMGLLLWWKPFNPADVATVLRLIGEGKVRPTIDRRYRLDDIAAALRYVDEGKARGKVIIEVGAPEAASGAAPGA